MARIKDPTFNDNRRLMSLLNNIPNPHLQDNGKVYSFENDKGDQILVTPTDVKDVLYQFIDDEISKYPELKSNRIKKEIESKLNDKFEKMESVLFQFLNDKINKITQDIVSKSNQRLIEAEVNKQLDERIEKIKKLL